jgi:hypothetical protein
VEVNDDVGGIPEEGTMGREPGGADGEAIRRQIRERLARGIYQRERARDRTDDRPRAAWEDLNQGRRATRLNYADDLLATLFGALGLGWDEVDGIRACARSAALAGAEEDQRAAAVRAADVVAALLPKRVGRGGGEPPADGPGAPP